MRDAARIVARDRHRRAADIIVHELDGAADVDLRGEFLEGHRNDARVLERDRFIEIAPAQAGLIARQALDETGKRQELVGDALIVRGRELRKVQSESGLAAAQPILVEQSPVCFQAAMGSGEIVVRRNHHPECQGIGIRVRQA